MNEISVETIILSQLWMKTSEEMVALPKSNDCPRVQRVGKILTVWSQMVCVWQKLNRYTSNDLQGRVLRSRIDGEHNLRVDVNLWVKRGDMKVVLEHE